MSKAPFFISAPRTRSSVLFETAQFYVENAYNLKPLGNHTELFLEFSRNAEFLDVKEDKKYTAELYPIASGGNLNVHYVYPPVFKTRKDRNLYKIQTLEYLKLQGNEFNIKGTMQIIDTYPSIIEFYKDRHFVITKRRNITDYVCSFFVAYTSKLFHARPNNLDRYKKIIQDKVHIDPELFPQIGNLLKQTKQLWQVESLLKEKGYSYSVTYYEDLDTQQKINNKLTEILQTEDWIKYLPDNYSERVPIKIDKDYSEIISNYEDIKNSIKSYIKDSDIERYI
jgi:hypothetical protein